MADLNAYSDLYSAQSQAYQSVRFFRLPEYDPASIEWDRGFGDKALWVYDRATVGATELMERISVLVYLIFSSLDEVLSGSLSWMRDGVYPINPINGERHFVLMSRRIEKFLGDYLFYYLSTQAMSETSELLEGTKERIATRVDTVAARVLKENEALLNPEDESTKFDYGAKTVLSSQINASAMFGGNMVVYSQIVKEIHGAIVSEQFKTATVTFADGSSAVLDLREVELNSVLAALLGHEATHIASRHSVAAMGLGLLSALLLNIGRHGATAYFKSLDKRYQELSKKGALSLNEAAELAKTEKSYDDFFQFATGKVGELTKLFHSRWCEHEADVTGAYLAYKAGLNPIGAIYLQEFLKTKTPSWSRFMHNYFEVLCTHPDVERRKRALYEAIQTFAPEYIQDARSEHV